jgi:hypothetical protein
MIRDIGFGRRCAGALLWTASVLLPGCGPTENLPECAPVTGKVTIGGQPLASAMVTFHPEGEGNKGQASTEVDGTYVLNTYDVKDGAVVGKHTVTVERYLPPMPTQPGGKIPTARSTVPKKYNTPETSPLKVEVKKGEKNVIDLPLDEK